MSDEMLEKLTIREILENWVLWRDAGDWERFKTVWHVDGRMMATWFQGTALEFIERSREARDRGVRIHHFLGGTTIDLAGSRAIAQTKMTITQRATVHQVLVDVVCSGRFFDFFEKRDGRWGISLRQPIYEMDRMDPLDHGCSLSLDMMLLRTFPEGYRHLAYLQQKNGFPVKNDMPCYQGAELEDLYERGRKWLRGSSTPGDAGSRLQG